MVPDPCRINSTESMIDAAGCHIVGLHMRGRQPVFFPLHRYVDSWCFWRRDESQCGGWLVSSACIGHSVWFSIAESSLCTAAFQRRDEVILSNTGTHPWKMGGTHTPWDQIYAVVKLAVDSYRVTGSWPCWTTVFCDWVAQDEGRCAEHFGISTPQ